MTISDIYNLAIELGIANDPRGAARVKKQLLKQKDQFKKLNQKEKGFFDQDALFNPYPDTRILNDVGGSMAVKTILAGIDISVSEILLADRLGEKKQPIDLVLGHHPLGRALARLDQVVKQQADFLSDLGVPINIAESLLEKRVDELGRKLSPGNHNRVVDAAGLMATNLLCVHTPCDNLVYRFVHDKIKKENPETVEELFNLIQSISEYQAASRLGIGPKIFAGKPQRRCGRIALTEVTGGTSGHKNIYEKLAQAGVGTIVGMHMEEEYREEAEKQHLNVVIAGHMPSDSLGFNLFLDRLEKRGTKVIPCSGLIRVKRG